MSEWAALTVGVAALASAHLGSSTRVGENLALASAAFITFYAVLALLVRNRRPRRWGLMVVGLMTVIAPWLSSGVAADPGAARTCWVAGSLAMVLGAIGWLAGKPYTEYGINEPTTRRASAGVAAVCISSMALALGVVTIARAALHTHPTGLAVTIGFGAMIAAIALWSLLVTDPTHHYLTVTVLGFALLLAPGFGGFTDDAAAFTAWASGLGATTLGLGGYLRGETPDLEATDPDPATARYHQQHRYPRRSTRRLNGRGNNGQQPVGRDRGRSPAGNRVVRRRDHDRGICAPVAANRNPRHKTHPASPAVSNRRCRSRVTRNTTSPSATPLRVAAISQRPQ